MNNTWFSDKKLLEVDKKQYLENKPFEHLSIDNLFNEDKINGLVKALEDEEYYIEDHDLYQFFRTQDFKDTKNKIILEFRDIIFSDLFVSQIERIVGFKLIRGNGDLHSLKLEKTHYLLCHDDQVERRAVAFILNLSDKWNEEDGGILEFFSVNSKGHPVDVERKIIPKFNQFNLFTVSSKSFHQICEVLSENKSRLSISGWFYREDTK